MVNNVSVIVAKLYGFTDVPSPFDVSLILWLSSYTISLPLSIGAPGFKETDFVKDWLNLGLVVSSLTSDSSSFVSSLVSCLSFCSSGAIFSSASLSVFLESVLLSCLSAWSSGAIFSLVSLPVFLTSVIVSLANTPSAKTTVFGTIIPNSIIKTKNKAVNFCSVFVLSINFIHSNLY